MNSQLENYPKDPHELRLNARMRNMSTPSVSDLNIVTKGTSISPGRQHERKGPPQVKKTILGGDAPNVQQIRNLIQSRVTPLRLV